jgi:hypothetical protein
MGDGSRSNADGYQRQLKLRRLARSLVAFSRTPPSSPFPPTKYFHRFVMLLLKEEN